MLSSWSVVLADNRQDLVGACVHSTRRMRRRRRDGLTSPPPSSTSKASTSSSSLKDTLLTALLWINILLVQRTQATQTDYCQFENFNASCGPNQVILMEHARYGRMHIGRCVGKSFGHIGCAANVLELVDKDCSGVRSCVFDIPGLRDVIYPCPSDLTAYLEAKYTCIDVIKYKYNDCNRSIQLHQRNNSIYISTEPAARSPDGLTDYTATSIKCPVKFHALPGQTLNFTLYRFGHQSSSARESSLNLCPLKISFTESNGNGRDVSQCDLSHREQSVYISKTDSATVFFHKLDDENDVSRILMKVEAVGCPNLKIPTNAWVERKGDKSIVRCNHTQETWYVTCTGNNWTGHVTNCTTALVNPPDKINKPESKGQIPLGLVVAVTIGVILGVMFGIAMLITVFVYRRKRKSPKASKTTSLLSSTGADDATHDNDENYSRRVWIEHKHDDPYGRICLGHNPPSSQHAQYASSATDYSHMFELQCSARAHGLASNDYHTENPYGPCRRPVGSGRMAADDLHSCNTLPISALTGNNSPSFATFKASNERSPSKTLKPTRPVNRHNTPPGRSLSTPAPATSGPSSAGGAASGTLGGPGNKSRSQYVANAPSERAGEDVTSPEHQPDLVKTNTSDRVISVLDERPMEQR